MKHKPITLDAALERWQGSLMLAGKSERTIRKYHGVVYGFTHTVPTLSPRDITRQQIEQSQDLALLIFPDAPARPYLAIDYQGPNVGCEIGIAGCPLPQLTANGGRLQTGGLIYRVAKNVVTATYTITNINTNTGAALTNMPIIEVNFLFVPGNSGGPIFSAETSRAYGFVHGFNPRQIHTNVSAVYSLAFAFSRVRQHLEQFGVAL